MYTKAPCQISYNFLYQLQKKLKLFKTRSYLQGSEYYGFKSVSINKVVLEYTHNKERLSET